MLNEPIVIADVDVPLSRLVLGTMSFGDTADATTAAQIFEAALEAGVTGVDCANGYAKGTTEEIIAPLVSAHRSEIVLATKVGMPHPDDQGRPPLAPESIRACLDGSLRRLGVDYVDIYYLHQPDRRTPLTRTMETIAQLHREGKFKALGVSNFAAWQVADIEYLAREFGAPRPIIGQNVYNLVARRLEDEWLEFASAHDIVTMCYNPLAGGLLVAPPSSSGAPTRFSGSVLADMYRKRYWTPEVLGSVDRIAAIADEAGTPLPELGLRWLVSQPGVGSLLLGGDKVEHVMSNIASIGKGPLPDDLVRAVSAATDPLKGSMPAYNR
ncbi:aldo/keto reductase [Brooklawnia cerclae]|uniref:Aryl-alcohol dehydrogenase-like predicted oxidoreductase n=1 Tax=Brooklawnia cerclae TaxID=349934 RepID=A0ABX0SC81_9ACTN|nr:aldo/keto reductase [Brooklawnia cerclae]NIH55999.1 aryl-alcohol dehydrogenase-like predicted oxidoreductase [Brooklawnia cerclae]